MSRTLSYSEITSALSCPARWSYSYGGQLTGGDTLKKRAIGALLSDGSAWGAAVAAYHQHSSELFPMDAARTAMYASYARDLQSMGERGVTLPEEDVARQQRDLLAMLEHYVEIGEPLTNLTRLEGEIDVPILARGSSSKSSSRYRFLCLIDGYNIDRFGNAWLVEVKLRTQLTSVANIMLGRQSRWYAWARRQQLRRAGVADVDAPIVGVIVDERLKAFPKPPRLVKGKRKADGMVPSHAVDQVCRPQDYEALCAEYGVEPSQDALAAMRARVWQQRVPIPFRPSELDEAGLELTSSAQLIRDLDGGTLFPVRNASARLCGGCDFRQICANPDDRLHVDSLFVRTVPKRLRGPREKTQPTRKSGRGDMGNFAVPAEWTAAQVREATGGVAPSPVFDYGAVDADSLDVETDQWTARW